MRPPAAPGRQVLLIVWDLNAQSQTRMTKNVRCAHCSGIGV